MKKAKKITLILSTILILTLIMTTMVFATTYQYLDVYQTGYIPGYHNAVDDANLFILNSDDGSVSISAYCADEDMYIYDASYYNIDTLSDDYVRAVVSHTYPVVSLQELISNVPGVDTSLTLEEVISASQYAVWHYTNGVDLYTSIKGVTPTANITALYNYLVGLAPLPAHQSITTKVTTPSYNFTGTSLVVSFGYYAELSDGTRVDMSQMDVQLSFNKAYESISKTVNPDYSVSVAATFSQLVLPYNDNLSISISGSQLDGFSLLGYVDEEIVSTTSTGLEGSIDSIPQYIRYESQPLVYGVEYPFTAGTNFSYSPTTETTETTTSTTETTTSTTETTTTTTTTETTTSTTEEDLTDPDLPEGLDDLVIPEGSQDILPKTSGIPSMALYLIGSGITGVGILIKKKYNK